MKDLSPLVNTEPEFVVRTLLAEVDSIKGRVDQALAHIDKAGGLIAQARRQWPEDTQVLIWDFMKDLRRLERILDPHDVRIRERKKTKG